MTKLELMTAENKKLRILIEFERNKTAVIQEEKTDILEKLWLKIEEIEKLKPFWRFFKYVKLVANMILEIKDWRNRHKADRVQKANGDIIKIEESPL